MNTKEHNGWTNYETWLVNVWLSNDQGTSDYVQALVVEAKGKPSLAFRIVCLLDALHNFVVEMVGEECGSTGLARDLMNAALAEVNWRELATNYLKAE